MDTDLTHRTGRRAWRALTAALAVLLLGAGVLLDAHAAAASNPLGGSYWHGRARFYSSCCLSGQAANLYLPAGGSYVQGSHYLQTQWFWTGSGTTYWIEAGWSVGALANFSSTGEEWYWGDFRPLRPGETGNAVDIHGVHGWYFDHDVAAATPIGSYHQVMILRDSTPGNYAILFDGTIYGWSTYNPVTPANGATQIDVGVETNNTSNVMPITNANGLMYRNGFLDWISGWANASSFYDGSSPNPCAVWWAQQWTSFSGAIN